MFKGVQDSDGGGAVSLSGMLKNGRDVGLIIPYASVRGLGEYTFHDIRCGISLT
jgi:hypothetical protein